MLSSSDGIYWPKLFQKYLNERNYPRKEFLAEFIFVIGVSKNKNFGGINFAFKDLK